MCQTRTLLSVSHSISNTCLARSIKTRHFRPCRRFPSPRPGRTTIRRTRDRSRLFSALHTVPDVNFLSGDWHEFAPIKFKFNPMSEVGNFVHIVQEFSTSPPRVFYASLVRTFSGERGGLSKERAIRLHIISKSRTPSGSDRRGAGGTHAQVSVCREVQVIRTS